MNDKQLVARHAAAKVKDGMLVGLGTGSTAHYFIEELARLRDEQGLAVTTVASSVVSAIRAQELGLPMVSIEQIKRLDLYVDGADEVAADLTLLKGQGADLVREKILAGASDCFWVLVDQSKLVERIGGNYAIPVEVMPFAWQSVKRRLEDFGGQGSLRRISGKDGLAVTAYGSLVLDMVFDSEIEAGTLDNLLNGTPGVVEHGIFTRLASAVFVGSNGMVEERWATDRE